jgi:hypothetical protein
LTACRRARDVRRRTQHAHSSVVRVAEALAALPGLVIIGVDGRAARGEPFGPTAVLVPLVVLDAAAVEAE